MTEKHDTTPGLLPLRSADPARSAEQAQGRRAYVRYHQPKADGRPRVALYYRVSTQEQVEKYGFDVQLRRLPEVSQQMGWQVVAEYEEPGVSGESLDHRDAMLQLLEDAETDMFDVVLVIEEKRISRGDMMDWGRIIDVFRRNNVSIANQYGIQWNPASADSEIMLWLKCGMGADEKRELARRTKGGRTEAILNGHFPHGMSPFGYRFERYGKKRCEKRLVIVEEEAKVVRLIYHLAVHGGDQFGGPMGGSRIAHHLNTLTIAPPSSAKWGHFTKLQTEVWNCDRWNGWTVRNMLRNSVYRGEWYYGKTYVVAAQKPRVERPRRPGHSSLKTRAEGEPHHWEHAGPSRPRPADRRRGAVAGGAERS